MKGFKTPGLMESLNTRQTISESTCLSTSRRKSGLKAISTFSPSYSIGVSSWYSPTSGVTTFEHQVAVSSVNRTELNFSLVIVRVRRMPPEIGRFDNGFLVVLLRHNHFVVRKVAFYKRRHKTNRTERKRCLRFVKVDVDGSITAKQALQVPQSFFRAQSS